MASPRVRADHEALKQVAAGFGAQADAARRTLLQLQRQADVLRAGDWVGRGADAFQREMNDAILPAFRRLVAALEKAQQATLQVSRRLQQAEADAARVLRAERVAGETDSGDTAGVGVETEGSPQIGDPLEAGPAFIPTLRPPNPRAMRQARARQTAAAQSAAVANMLSIFDPQVRELAAKSPTLRAQMLALQKKGILFQTGPRSQTIEPFITIADTLTGGDAVAMIAHETGHVMNNYQEHGLIVETPDMTRDQYVSLNVANNLHNETLAQFNALQVRAELLAAGAGDIGVPGNEDAGFQQVYADYVAGRITKDQAIERMSPVMGNVLRDAGPPPQTYRDYAIDYFRKDWDTYIGPKRRP